MALQPLNQFFRRPAVAGGCAVTLAGLVCAWLPAGGALRRLSFDLPTVLHTASGFPELALIEMDEPSHRELHQERSKPWDRRIHAQLVDYLRRDGAHQIVFDTEFYESVPDTNANTALATAFGQHGRVVLAAQQAYIGKPGFNGTALLTPVPELLGPGVIWGVSWSMPGPRGEEDGIVRRHPTGRDPDPALIWRAASGASAAVTTNGAAHDAERWVRHYGPFGTLPGVSYWQATNEAPGFYRGKTIFIGGRPGTGFVGQEADQFRTPWSRWHGSQTSGMELSATAFLNLVRGDWIRRAPPAAEAGAIVLFGVIAGAFITGNRFRKACLAAVTGAAVAAAAGGWLYITLGIWSAWTIPALVQIPLALAWSAAANHLTLRREMEWLEAPLEGLFPDSASLPASSSASNPGLSTASAANAPTGPHSATRAAGAPPIPDYELLRCVGRGAYGEVWLGQDVLGGLRAVKIVRRIAFDDDGPYEREFRGLQRFAPISREHPGLVQILHVGLNRAGGYFYYVMEAGDDERSGSEIAPEHYTPRNLARDLRARRDTSTGAAAQLGIALSEAVEFLHHRNLIHRDIKPANVIFVQGRPKLADVGLITELSSRAQGITQVGTEGYIPPEGTGTAGGDIFALGRLLEEALGPTASPEDAATAALRDIARHAQAGRPEDRLPSATALSHALKAWQNKYLPAPPQRGSIVP